MQDEAALIWNPILRQHLVNAPHRMNRREGTTACPFCADMTNGRVDAQTQVWLHPNDFPPVQPPTGEAYVVIYSRDHDRTFTQLSVDEVNAVTHLWRDLYNDLASRYAAVMIFENSGASIGQTQYHPHGQAYGVSIIPPTLERELETVVQDQAAGRGCPFCRVRAELSDDVHEVTANTTWQAFLPPYLLGIHQLADEQFHLHVEIQAIGRAPGKLKFAASSEAPWGLSSNDSPQS